MGSNNAARQTDNVKGVSWGRLTLDTTQRGVGGVLEIILTQRLYYYHRPPPLCCVKLNFPLTLCKKELAAENVVVHSLY